MINKKWFWIGMALLVIALMATVIGINIWYNSGTVRVSGDDIRIDMEGTGYIFDPQTGEVKGQTPVRISGKTQDANAEVFDGNMEVLGYLNQTGGTITTTSVVQKDDSGFWWIECLETCLHYEQTGDDTTTPVEHICDYHYTYYFYPENEDFLVVMIKDFDEKYPAYVVLGDSEAQARETYKWFMENKPNS